MAGVNVSFVFLQANIIIVFFDICREIILGEPHHFGGESLK